MSEISYDQLISTFIDARVESDDAIWKQGAIAFFLKDKMGVKGRQIASDTNYSESYISKLIKTFTAFPEESNRAIDKSFSLHMTCADTDDPVGWLDRAVEHSWSVRELARAIRGEKPVKSDTELAVSVWDKVLMLLDGRTDGANWLRDQILEYQLSQ